MNINNLNNIEIPKDLEEALAQDSYVDAFGHKYTHESLLKGIVNSSVWGNDNGNNGDDGEGNTDDVSLDPSLFKRNPNGWNIKNACEWLQKNSHTESTHRCAKYVRMAIEAGGLSTAGRPTWAWMYINFLPKIGFKHIGTYVQNGYTPEPGDIAVYLKGGNTKVPGHICMWTGIQWCSDFKQNNMIVYRNTKEAYIFRFQ